ncbi:MAG: O-antigen ligase family protein [Anaerolineae bacterium]
MSHLTRLWSPRKGAGLGLTLLGLILYTLCLALLGGLAFAAAYGHRWTHRGITYGPPPDVPLAVVEPLGVNASLEQYAEAYLQRALALIGDGGFHWVRQPFPWAQIEPQPGEYRWEPWDRIVDATQEHNLALIAVLDTSPPWARGEADQDNPYAPPQDVAHYARFVKAFVARYRGRIGAYQLWDEPNIRPHWGDRDVDPAGYVALLRAGYLAAKEADPQALILSAGLAPNTEGGGPNMSDLLFLEGMYRAGAREVFDILAIKPYGLWTGPEDRRASPQALNFSRAILLREIMVRHGDGGKAAWAVEFGWNALPSDWRGRPSPWGTDAEAKQARRTVEAIQRAQEEWPWLGAMILQGFQPAAPPDDPVHGFALMESDFTPRATYEAVRELAASPPVAPVGRYPATAWMAKYRGAWLRDGEVMRSQGAGAELILPFKGTRLDLVAQGEGSIQVTVDGGEPVVVALRSSGPPGETITLARGLPYGQHLARLAVEGSVAVAGWVVAREADFTPYYASLALLGVGFLVVLWRWWRLVPLVPWAEWWRGYARRYGALTERGQVALMALAIALFYLSPWLPLSLAALIVLASLIALRLDLGLAFLVLTIPFFLYPKPIGPKALSLVEVLTLLCFAAWLLLRFTFHVSRFTLHASSLDLPIVLFLLVSLLSPLMAENRGVALRELRVVVVEPALLYLMLRNTPLSKQAIFRLMDALILAGLAVSLVGLYQYFVSGDVIVVEGVRRVHGVYASPNNLSLFLGRVLPPLAVLALWGPGDKRSRSPTFERGSNWDPRERLSSQTRRILYGLAGLPIVPALYLTYSRGAWLLGLPIAFLFIGFLRGRRTALAALGLVLLALLSLLPFAQAERIASLFDFQAGSTTFLRLKLWQASLNMIRDHPLFGVGLDNFLYQYRDRYVLPEALVERNLSHPHNIVLDFWTRLGILGVVAIIWLEIIFFREGLRLYRGLRDPDLRILALGLMASMADCLAHGLIDNSYFLVDLAFVFMLTVGLVRRMTIAQEGGW